MDEIATTGTVVTGLTRARTSFDSGMRALARELTTDLPANRLAEIQQDIITWSSAIEDFMSNVKQRLLRTLQASGEKVTEKGTLRMAVNGWLIEARPTRTGLDPKRLEALLRAKRIDPARCMDAEVTYKVNAVKLLEYLNNHDAWGLQPLTQDEVDTCTYPLNYSVQTPKKVE